jgi:competence protein ComEC
MSEDGRVLGLRDERGRVYIASARTDRLISEAWARRSGQEGAKRWTVSADEQAAGLGCNTGLCHWRKGLWRIALVSDDRQLAEACGSADIVLSTVDAQGRCRGPRLVIDRALLSRVTQGEEADHGSQFVDRWCCVGTLPFRLG